LPVISLEPWSPKRTFVSSTCSCCHCCYCCLNARKIGKQIKRSWSWRSVVCVCPRKATKKRHLSQVDIRQRTSGVG